MSKSCPNCSKLQSDLDATKKELAEVKVELNYLRRLIAQVVSHCGSKAASAAAEMSHGGLGVARYSELKGINILANQVLKNLGLAGVEIKTKGGKKQNEQRNRRSRGHNRNTGPGWNRLFNLVAGFWGDRYRRR